MTDRDRNILAFQISQKNPELGAYLKTLPLDHPDLDGAKKYRESFGSAGFREYSSTAVNQADLAKKDASAREAIKARPETFGLTQSEADFIYKNAPTNVVTGAVFGSQSHSDGSLKRYIEARQTPVATPSTTLSEQVEQEKKRATVDSVNDINSSVSTDTGAPVRQYGTSFENSPLYSMYQRGLTQTGSNFNADELKQYMDLTRKEYRDRVIISGSNVPHLFRWQQDLSAELKKLERAGLISAEDANNFRHHWSHRGAVAIPGYASRGNFESNLNLGTASTNLADGTSMTLADIINAERHMSTLQGYTLSPESKKSLEELIEAFPNSTVAKKAQDVLDNIPSSSIDVIDDPNRAAFNSDPTRQELLVFRDAERGVSAGTISAEIRGEDARNVVALGHSLDNFDADTQNKVSPVSAKEVTQEDLSRISNISDEVKAEYRASVEREVIDDAKNNRVRPVQDILSSAIENMPEGMRGQLGFSDVKVLAATTGLAALSLAGVAGVAKLTGMSEEEKDNMYQGIADKAMSGLAAYGEVVDSGYEAFEQIPGYNSVTGFYDNAVDWLNNISNKGGVSQSGGYYGEDGSWVAGETFDNTYGAGDLIDTGIQTVNPADEVAAVTGLIRNIWNNNDIDNQDSGGGGF